MSSMMIKNFQFERFKNQYYECFEKVSFEASEFVAKKRLETIMRCAGVGSFPITPSKKPFEYPCYYASNSIMEICLYRQRNGNRWILYAIPHGGYNSAIPGHFYMAQNVVESIRNLKDESEHRYR